MCDCRMNLNEKLAPLNARLAYGFTFGKTMELSPPLIQLEKIAPRGKKPPVLLASFCPFCGEKYEQDDDPPLTSGERTP